MDSPVTIVTAVIAAVTISLIILGLVWRIASRTGKADMTLERLDFTVNGPPGKSSTGMGTRLEVVRNQVKSNCDKIEKLNDTVTDFHKLAREHSEECDADRTAIRARIAILESGV